MRRALWIGLWTGCDCVPGTKKRANRARASRRGGLARGGVVGGGGSFSNDQVEDELVRLAQLEEKGLLVLQLAGEQVRCRCLLSVPQRLAGKCLVPFAAASPDGSIVDGRLLVLSPEHL